MPVGVFPYRRTIVTLDDYLPSVVQAWTAIQRQANQIGRTTTSELSNVAYIPGIGWRLRAYQTAYSDVQELTDAQDGIYTSGGGGLTIAPGFVEFDSFAKDVIPGISYSGSVQAAGSPMFQKRVAAGDSWSDARLDADETAFPGPFPSENTVDLDRVAITTGNHEPWDPLMFSFALPVSAIGGYSWVASLYFCGPAGSDRKAADDETKLGTGRYCVKFRGDGLARLYELLDDDTWTFRFEFKWAENSSPAPWRVCTCHIVSDCYQDGEGNYQGSRITFIPIAGFGESYNLVLSSLAGIVQTVLQNATGATPIYNVPRLTQQPTTQDVIRIDVARNVRAICQIARHVYPESGYLIDDVISLDCPATPDVPIYLYWKGILPSGTSWTATMYDAATGDPLTPATTVTTNGSISFQGFTPTDRQRHARVKIGFTANGARTRTPTLTEYALYRSPTYQDVSPVTPVELYARENAPALPKRVVKSISITPQETDPSGESAVVMVDDLTGELSQLRSGQMRPISIDVEVDAEGTLASLFRGYASVAVGNPGRTSPTRNYPSKNRRKFNLSCVGEWARLYEAIAQRRLPWTNPETGDPFKVTDVIRILLQTVYPEEYVDVPDLPITLFSTSSDAYITEPGARIGDVARSLADDYLGAYLLFDQAAGTKGMWRLLQQKAPPYNNLAVFEVTPPGSKKLPHYSPSYGTSTSGDQTIEHTYIVADTYSEEVQPAEGNYVVCYGSAVGQDASAAGAQDAGLLTQIAIQTDSFNFLGLPPEHEHYPDGASPNYYGRVVPIKVVDFKLTTQDAVDWKCRRVFDRACWARKVIRFTAPLLLVQDVSDTLQERLRPLRYYDAVQVKGWDGDLVQYLVMSCAPSYVKDHIQMAEYVLVTQGNIDQIAVMPPQNTAYDLLRKVVSRSQGKGLYVQDQYSAQRGAEHMMSTAMGLPESFAEALQDLDPSSETFGQFRDMPGYLPS